MSTIEQAEADAWLESMTWVDLHNHALRHETEWSLHRPLLPHKCIFTHKWLWVKPAIRGRSIGWDSGTSIILGGRPDCWGDPASFTWWKLKEEK